MGERDYSKTPTLKDLGDPHYMGKPERPKPKQPDLPDLWPKPPIVSFPPISSPSRGEQNPPIASDDSFGSGVKTLALIGGGLCAAYAYLALHLVTQGVIGWGVAGLLAGGIAGAALWAAIKILEVALKILVFMIQAAFVLGGLYLLWYVFLR